MYKRQVVEALDFSIKQDEKTKVRDYKNIEMVQKAIPESFFPPCIKRILQGLEDGRKRSLFILVNFLTSCGWSYEKISELLNSWNQRNKEPLRSTLLVSQVRYHKKQKRIVLPPNCNNANYYKDIQVCFPDNLCQKIKNHVAWKKCKKTLLLLVSSSRSYPMIILKKALKKIGLVPKMADGLLAHLIL